MYGTIELIDRKELTQKQDKIIILFMYYLYRLYNKNDELIYIGCTYNVEKRLKTHEYATPWFHDEVKRTTCERVSDNKRLALIAEQKAIMEEQPLHNVHKRKPAKKVAKPPKYTSTRGWVGVIN